MLDVSQFVKSAINTEFVLRLTAMDFQLRWTD